MGGHDTGDTFLTGAFLNNKFLVNTISVDQLAHDWDKPGGAEKLGQWDRFMAEQLAYFLDRLESAQEDNGSLLDNSVVLYGSSNSVTHDNNNYPLVLAGGAAMGLKHGRCLKLSDTVPMSNLFVTLLNCLGDSSPSFADSTGNIPELTSSFARRPVLKSRSFVSRFTPRLFQSVVTSWQAKRHCHAAKKTAQAFRIRSILESRHVLCLRSPPIHRAPRAAGNA